MLYGIKMKIREFSDLHLEFYKSNENFEIPKLPDDKNTVLILAGDIILANRIASNMHFFKECSERFRDVIYIMGNHEYYGSHLVTGIKKINEALSELSNVHVLDKQSIVIDNTAFICATMWSDFDKGNPICMMNAQGAMNDYKKIRYGPIGEPWKKKISPAIIHAEFLRAKEFIFDEIVVQKELGNKVVVVTHMGPSYQSVAKEFRGDSLNGAYVSELGNEIVMFEPELWFHGHTHVSFDYMIGKTRVICNPFGYLHHEENPSFNCNFIIEV